MNTAKGHVLIVARHFPPAVSGGARRPFLIATGLAERGWRVTIASPVAPATGFDWIETPHPAGLRGEAFVNGETAPPQPIKSFLRSLIYWPDNDMRWALGAVRAIERAKIRPDWIMTTSPPESAHLAGVMLRRRIGARWLAELRDSWIDDPLREELRRSKIRRTGERLIARATLGRADRIVAVSNEIAAEAGRYRPRNGTPIDVIGHFARASNDQHCFVGEGPHLVHSGRFSLSHAGRRIDALLEAFSIAANRHEGMRLHLVGLLTAEEQRAVGARPDAHRILIHGEVSHGDAQAMQRGADALILYQSGTSALPGKLGEYLACAAPIVVLGDGSWRARMSEIPHFEFTDIRAALAAPPRQPSDSVVAALDRYEALFLALGDAAD